jgi:hypothetical protein
MGALSDVQAQRAMELITEAGQQVDHQTFPTTGHSIHGESSQRFADTLVARAATLP